jgi:hypothetical protein
VRENSQVVLRRNFKIHIARERAAGRNHLDLARGGSGRNLCVDHGRRRIENRRRCAIERDAGCVLQSVAMVIVSPTVSMVGRVSTKEGSPTDKATTVP